jgi:hypothetical protein
LENSDLDSNQKEKFLAFLGKNRNVFAKDLSELGCCKNVYKHKIDKFIFNSLAVEIYFPSS